MKNIFAIFLMLLSFSKAVSNDVQWSFPPDTLSSANQNASDPRIAIDGAGNLVALWLEGDSLKVSTKLADASWTGAVTLAKSQASSPRLVSGSDGQAIALWIENGIVKSASKTLNGKWSSASSLSKNGATSPDLAIAPSGNAVAVWVNNGNIESATKSGGKNWTSNSTIITTGAASPHVALGGSKKQETAAVVWHTYSGIATSVYAAIRLTANDWGTPQIISDSEHEAAYAHVAIDPNANVTAIWYAYDVVGSVFSQVNVQSAMLPFNDDWSNPVSLSAAGMRDPSTLMSRITYDATGNATALWSNSYDGETFNIEAATKPVWGDWMSATTIVDTNLYAYSGDLSSTSLGDALALYMFYNGAFILIQSTETDMTGVRDNTWSVPINLSFGASNGFPRVSAVLNGNVLNAAAIWVSHNGSYTTISAATGQRTVTSPPSDLDVSQSSNNFGVFTENFNTLQWTSSPDANIVGYVIFRNGMVLEQVASDVLQIVDHNQIHKGPVTYGVAAVNDQNSLSQVITVSFP